MLKENFFIYLKEKGKKRNGIKYKNSIKRL